MCVFSLYTYILSSPLATEAMASSGSGVPAQPDVNVADLLKNLNLTMEEEMVVTFSDDDEDTSRQAAAWALLGKVLSPSVVHAFAI